MNCQDFENQIQRLLDRRVDLNSSQPIQCHASRCDSCARKLTIYSELFEADSHGKSILEDSVGELMLMDYDPSQSEKLVFTRRTQQLAGALAACVALILVTWLSFLGGSNSGNDSTNIAIAAASDSESTTSPIESGSAPLNHDAGLIPGSRDDSNSLANDSLNHNSLETESHPALVTYQRLGLSRAFWPTTRSNGKAKLSQVVFQRRHPIESIQSYYNYTSSLPGVKPWASGLNQAARLIQKSIEEEKPVKPDKSSNKGDGRKWRYDNFDSINWSPQTIA